MRLTFAEFELDTERELLIGPAGPVSLRRQTYRMLLHLLERAPALVTRNELMDALWGHHALSPNVVPQTISELRQALGDDAQQPRFIETRHRRGYVFVAQVQRQACETESRPDEVPLAPNLAAQLALSPAPATRIAPSPADGGTIASSATSMAQARPIGGFSPAWLGLLVLVALLGLLAVWFRPSAPSNSVTTSTSMAAGLSNAVVLHISADPAHVELAALLRSSLRQSALVVLPPDSPARSAPGLSIWTLDLLPGASGWRLQGPDTAVQAVQGGWNSAELAARHNALLDELAQRWPLQLHELDWPEEPEAIVQVARGLHAADTEQLAQASTALRLALRGGPSRMVRFALARVLARTGEWREATAVLAGIVQTTARKAPADLLTEALRAELAGQPGEAMAALRAYLHLVPLDVDGGLLLLQWQLRQRQWESAQSTLDELEQRAGWTEHQSPLHVWRARVLAGQGRLDAALSLAQAVQVRAQDAGDRVAAELAIRAQTEILQRQSKLPAAAALLATVEAATAPDLAMLRGSITRELGQLDQAQQILLDVERAYRARGRLGDALRARLELAIIDLRRGQIAPARDVLLQLQQLAAKAGEPRLLGDLHAALGLAHAALGEMDAARTSLEQAVAAAMQTADPLRIAGTQLNLGVMLMQQQRREAAQDAFVRAAEGFRSVGESRGEATAMANLGAIAAREGRHTQAREAYTVALQRQREHGATAEVGRIAFNLGLSARAQGDLSGAAQHFSAALEVLQSAAATDLVLQTAATWAELELLRGQPALAIDILASSATQLSSGTPLRQAAVAQARARLHELSGQTKAAREQLESARELRVQAKSDAWVYATDLRLLRLALLQSEDRPRVRVRIEQLAGEFARLGEDRDELLAQLLHVEAWQLEGNCASAEQILSTLRAPIHKLADRGLQLQLDWLASQCATGSERDERLLSLERAARAQGYMPLAQLAHYTRMTETDPARAQLQESLRAADLEGVLHRPSAVF